VALDNPSQKLYDEPEEEHPGYWLLLIAALLTYCLILFIFTTLTHSLDEIKLPLFYSLGSGLLFVSVLWVGLQNFNGRERPYLLPLVLLLGVNIVSTALSEFTWVGMLNIRFTLAWMGLFFTLAVAIQTHLSLSVALGFFIAVGFTEEVLALFHYCGGVNWLNEQWYPDGPPAEPSWVFQLIYTLQRSRNLFGTILNEDFYAAYLLTVAPLGLGGMFYFRNIVMRLMSFAVALLGASSLWITLSKDSLIALTLSAIVFFGLLVLRGKKAWLMDKRIWGGGVLLLLVFALLGVLIKDRILVELDTFDTAVSSRWKIYKGALKIFAMFPILGGGPGTFRIYFAQVRDDDYFMHEISNVTNYAHSLYLDFLSETGIVGLLVFLWFLGMLVWTGMKAFFAAADRGDNIAFVHAATLAAIAGISVQNAFSPSTRWIIGANFFYGLLGLAAGCYHVTLRSAGALEDQSAATKKPYRSIRQRLLGALGGEKNGAANLLFGSPDRLRIAAAFLAALGCLNCVYYSFNHWKCAVYHRQGLDHLQRQQFTEAIKDFRTALTYNDTFITTYYKLGHAIHQEGSRIGSLEALEEGSAEAKRVYDKLEEYWPRYAEIAHNLALINRLLYTRANQQLNAKVEEMNAEQRAAFAEEKKEEIEDLKSYYDTALYYARFFKRQSIKYTAFKGLADILNDRAYFVMRFKDTLELEETHEELFDEAMAMYEAGEAVFDEQIASGLSEINRRMLVDSQNIQFKILQELERWEEAAELGRELYRERSEDVNLAAKLVDILLNKLDRHEEAYELAAQIVEDNPIDAIRKSNMLQAALKSGRYEEVLVEGQKLRELLARRLQEGNLRNYPQFLGVLNQFENHARRSLREAREKEAAASRQSEAAATAEPVAEDDATTEPATATSSGDSNTTASE
jgi:O-antigen ligase